MLLATSWESAEVVAFGAFVFSADAAPLSHVVCKAEVFAGHLVLHADELLWHPDPRQLLLVSFGIILVLAFPCEIGLQLLDLVLQLCVLPFDL